MEWNKINGLKIFMIRLLEINAKYVCVCIKWMRRDINLSTFIPLDTVHAVRLSAEREIKDKSGWTQNQSIRDRLTIVFCQRESSETDNNETSHSHSNNSV